MELKPFAIIDLEERPSTKLTFVYPDGSEMSPEAVVYPQYIDWKLGYQRAWLGELTEDNLFRAYGSANYHSFSELIQQVRRVLPDVGKIRTIIPESNGEKVVIY
jgi:hypothetical protein